MLLVQREREREETDRYRETLYFFHFIFRHSWCNNFVMDRIGHACTLLPGTSPLTVGAIGGKCSENARTAPIEMKKMEFFEVSSGAWTLKNQLLPFMNEGYLIKPSLAHHDGQLILIGGQIHDDGSGSDAIFEHNSRYGFRILNLTLPTRIGSSIVMQFPLTVAEEIQAYSDSGVETDPPDFIAIGGHSRTLSSENFPFTDGSVPLFPLFVSDAAAIWYQTGPLVCGGYDVKARRKLSSCHWLKDGNWTQVHDMSRQRKGAKMALIQGNVWIFGGESQFRIEDTIEIFDGTTWEPSELNMPMGLSDYCLVTINDQELIISGGETNMAYYDSTTYTV